MGSPYFFSSIDVDESGNTVKTNFNKDIYKEKYIDSLDFNYCKDYKFKNTFVVNNNYYSLYVKPSIKISDNTTQDNPHIMAVCYDTNGSMLWRKGYDSVNTISPFSKYTLVQSTISKNNKLLLSLIHQDYYDRLFIKNLELDNNGEVLSNFEVPIDTSFKLIIKSMVQLSDNKYVFLCRSNDSSNIYFITLMNRDINSLTRKDIRFHFASMSLNYIYLSPENNIVFAGTIMDSTIVGDTIQVNERFCLMKYSSEGQLIWKYVKPNSNADLIIKEIKFIDEHNMLLLGSNGSNTCYFAKFSDEIQAVNESEIENISKIQIEMLSPNPTTNNISAVLKIFDINYNEIKAELFNSLGVKVMDLTNKFIWNKTNGVGTIEFSTEAIPAGAYYLGVSSKTENDIKGIIIQK